MVQTIERLREIVRMCRAGQRLKPADAQWLGAAFSDFLCQRCSTVDEALGLRFGRGGVPWWQEEAMRKRDAALRALATHYLGDLCKTAAAREVHRLSLRYATSAWRFDRDRDDMPAHYADTAREYLWRAFKSGARMPIGERHLRSLLD